MDSLKALDPERPIREADISGGLAVRMNHQCERNSDHDAVDTEGNKGACPDKCWQEFDAEQSVSSDVSMRQWALCDLKWAA